MDLHHEAVCAKVLYKQAYTWFQLNHHACVAFFVLMSVLDVLHPGFLVLILMCCRFYLVVVVGGGHRLNVWTPVLLLTFVTSWDKSFWVRHSDSRCDIGTRTCGFPV